MKFLAVDPEGQHPMFLVRLYRNKWDDRPTSVDYANLTVGTVGDSAGFGVGCMPLGISRYPEVVPEYLTSIGLTPEEREVVGPCRQSALDAFDYKKRQEEMMRRMLEKPLPPTPGPGYAEEVKRLQQEYERKRSQGR
jgi:hypothetical protein